MIATLVVAGVLALVFAGWQYHLNDRGLVPRGVFKSYSVWAIMIFALTTRFSFLMLIYYVRRTFPHVKLEFFSLRRVLV